MSEVTEAVETGFDLEKDYNEILVPAGKGYKGVIVAVGSKEEKPHQIHFHISLSDKDRKMSDNDTSVEGQTLFHMVILPKDENREEKISNGENKWQFFVNMLTRFAKNMDINMNTPAIIQDAVDNGTWLGIPVVMEVKHEEYQGVVSAHIKSIKRDKSPQSGQPTF